jgi:hypothetical protein
MTYIREPLPDASLHLPRGRPHGNQRRPQLRISKMTERCCTANWPLSRTMTAACQSVPASRVMRSLVLVPVANRLVKSRCNHPAAAVGQQAGACLEGMDSAGGGTQGIAE